MTLGAEPKKVMALGGLMLLAAYSFYTNVLSGPDVPESARQSARPAGGATPPAGAPITPAARETARRTEERKMLMGKQSIGDFHPVFKATNEKERPDPMKVDPTLRMDLVTRLQNVTLSGGQRSLFEISNLPEPVPSAGPGEKIQVEARKDLLYARLARPMGPDPKPVPPTPTPKPPPPPIPLKFYGYSTPQTGAKRAFFLEGEEIFVIKEGDLVKKRYRIVKIGLKSVVVEDVEHKHEQTMPLEEPPSNG